MHATDTKPANQLYALKSGNYTRSSWLQNFSNQAVLNILHILLQFATTY